MENLKDTKMEEDNIRQTRMLMNTLLFVAFVIFIFLVTTDPSYKAYTAESYSYAYPRIPGPSAVQEFIQFTELAEQQLRI